MKLKPILTEKSMSDAASGKYSFYVDPKYTKNQVKAAIEKIFDVKVSNVSSSNLKKRVKTNFRRQKKIIAAKKKVIVTLKGKGTIDLFDTKSE